MPKNKNPSPIAQSALAQRGLSLQAQGAAQDAGETRDPQSVARARGDRRFWAYDDAPPGEPAVLRLEGPISEETWWGDEVTPQMFRDELEAHPGDVVVYINSPGGDVIAATQIYTMLVEHKGSVTVKIEGLAASAASIVAMAGDAVLMAPTAYMMIHDAATIAIGNADDLRQTADMLAEIDRGIRDAYRLKTGLRDSKLEQMMDDETWMSARTAIELGFADGYIGAAQTAGGASGDSRTEGASAAQQDAPETRDPQSVARARGDDEDEDEDPDNVEHIDDRRPLPAVAFSGRRLSASLVAGLTAGLTAGLVTSRHIAAQGVTAASLGIAAGDPPEEAPASDPTDALKRRLALLDA